MSKVNRLIVLAFSNYRELGKFINEKEIGKESILKIDQKDSQIFILYYE